MIVSRWRERRKTRSGALAILVAFALVVIFALMALAVDASLMMENRRVLQAAADAAALAAATDLYTNYDTYKGKDTEGGGARNSAMTTAAANLHDRIHDGNFNVIVHAPGDPPMYPTPALIMDDAGRLKPGYVEVVIDARQGVFFSGIFQNQNPSIQARAVAQGTTKPGTTPGVIVLEPEAEFPVKITGDGTVRIPNAAIVVNSTHDRTVQHSGNGPIVVEDMTLTSEGQGYVSSGGGTLKDATGAYVTPKTEVPPTPDPLRNLEYPDLATLPDGLLDGRRPPGGKATISDDEPHTLSPSVFNGITISGNGSVTMEPGIYYIDGGGFQISGNGTVTGTGVTIFNAAGRRGTPADKISISGNGSIRLTPPTSGTYAGITIFQERTLGIELYSSGNGNINITGTVYAANAMVHVSGNGLVGVADSFGSQFICRYMQISGNGAVNINVDPNGKTSAIRTVRLVQ